MRIAGRMVGARRGDQREERQTEILEMMRELQCSRETERGERWSVRVAEWLLGQAVGGGREQWQRMVRDRPRLRVRDGQEQESK